MYILIYDIYAQIYVYDGDNTYCGYQEIIFIFIKKIFGKFSK